MPVQRKVLGIAFAGWAFIVNVCLYLQLWQKFHGYLVGHIHLLLMIFR